MVSDVLQDGGGAVRSSSVQETLSTQGITGVLTPVSSPPVAWRDRAICIGKTDLMFSCTENPYPEERVAEAKELCSMCPVREDCLDFAIGLREEYGIWGGADYQERRRIIRQMRKRGEPIPRYRMRGVI
jgi:WhiB family redox-sensing transcriptional regulator